MSLWVVILQVEASLTLDVDRTLPEETPASVDGSPRAEVVG